MIVAQSTIPNGTSTEITVTTTNTNYFVTNLPGFIGTSGTFPTPVLNSTVTYTFTAHGVGGKTATASVTISVVPATLLLDKIKKNPWVTVSGRSSLTDDENGTWWTMSVDDSKWVYKDNGKYDVYLNGALVIYNGDYSVSEASTILTRDVQNHRWI